METGGRTMPNYMYLGEMGTPEGPCSANCSHLICVMKRHDAEKLCPGCKEKIGLGSEIYLRDLYDWRGLPFELAQYWHRTCFEIYVNQERQRIAAAVALGVFRGDPLLESETDELRRAARVLKKWQEGDATNEDFNALGLYSRIQPSATKFRTISSAERIEEARKTDGVRRRGRRRAFLPARETVSDEAEEPAEVVKPKTAGRRKN